MKKVLRIVFCVALCAVLIVPQTVMAETLYVNSGTGKVSFNDDHSHEYTNAVIEGSTLEVKGQNGQHCSIVLTGSGKTFDVKGGTVNLQKGRVAEKDKNSGQTFKMNAGSLVMTADSQIQMSNFQMKTNDDPSKSASVSLNECSNGIDVTNEAWIEKGNVTLKKSKIKAKNDFRMTGGSITATEAKVDGGKEVILRQEGSATGGTITLKDGSTLCGDDVNMSAGNVTLSSNSEFTAGNIFAFSAGTISATNSMVGSGKTFNFSGGTLDSNVAWIGARGDESAIVGDVMTCGSVNMTNGTYNVSGGKEFASISDLQQTNALLGSTLNISGGAVNINEGSYLYTVKDVTFSGGYDISNISSFSKGTINLTDSGKINLAGCLVSDVSGNNTATIDFTSSNGKIEGNVNGVNLNFKEDNSLSSAITGTISSLSGLSVAENKNLNMDKSVGTISNLNSDGSINIGTNAVAATNVTFGSGSSLGINIASKTNYGSLTADTINITEGAKLNLTIDNGVLARDESADFTLLNAGTITGNFTKIAQNSRYEFTWNTTDEGKVTILGVATPGDIVDEAGGSKNNEATANAWDTIDTSSSQISEKGKEVADILNTLSQNATDKAGEKAYIDALTAVAPDATPSMQQTVSETANQIFTAVGTRLSGGSIPASSKQGISGGDFEFKNVAVWMQGLLNKAKYDTSKPANNFDSNSYGMALGIESYIVDDIAKAGLGYAYSGTNIDGYLRETDVKTNAAIIYGEYKPGNWFINGVISYGFSDYSETKKVSGTTVKADWKVNSLAAQVMTGYDVQLENNFMVIPEAGLRYVNINQDSYKDSADQEVSSHTGDILTGVIGGRINKTFKRKNGLSIVPEFKLAATYDLKNDDGSSTVTLANRTTYSVTGENLDKFGIETGIGVSADVTEKFIISLGYEGKFIKDYQDHTGLLNLKYKF